MHTPAAHTRQLRRARAVYGALKNPPQPATLLPELLALAALAIAAAGIVALRAWLAVGA